MMFTAREIQIFLLGIGFGIVIAEIVFYFGTGQ